MPTLVIELDDRALSLARDGVVLSSAPSTIFDGTNGSQAGTNSWRELRSRPTEISSRHLSAILSHRNASRRFEALVEAELIARLSEHPVTEQDRVWIVAPARSEPAGLAAVLGIVRRFGLHVEGLIDSAAVTAAALGSSLNALILEWGLHHTAATAVDCEGNLARRRRTLVSERGGIIELYQAWLELVSTTMVKRTRFDPLHDASTEQQLFDELPALAFEAASTGSATAVASGARQRFEVTLTRDQFSQAADAIFRAAMGLLHQLRPAGTSIAIALPRAVAALPGLREQLEHFSDCELVTVPDGFAASVASLLDLPDSPREGDYVRLLRRLHSQPMSQLGEGLTRERLGQRRMSGSTASHVLWDGRAYSLNVESLTVGRTVAEISAKDAARHIMLPDGLAGVSRRHCTFLHDGENLVLLDHSSFGTFVNGERVSERVRVHAGDRVRLGEPGVELALIAVGDVAAATTQQT